MTGNGRETHHGLVVTDAAVIPTALGVNPFATITALAERSVKLTAAKLGLEIDYETQNGKNLFHMQYKYRETTNSLWPNSQSFHLYLRLRWKDHFVLLANFFVLLLHFG